MNKMSKGTDGFVAIAREIFAPIYPVIAQKILDDSGLKQGLCLDIGSGPGSLGLALAELAPEMEVILYDKSQDMLDAASELNPFGQRVSLCRGRAESLPFEDNSVDLVASRGSFFFWEDQEKGLSEIYRVLRSGGSACIGGGFGNLELMEQIEKAMEKRDPAWSEKRKGRLQGNRQKDWTELLSRTEIPQFQVLEEEAGIWMHFSKL